jgi:hypothetical protein
MTDLEQRLRQDLATTASEVGELPTPQLAARLVTIRRRRRRHRNRVAATTVAIVAVLGVVAAIAGAAIGRDADDAELLAGPSLAPSQPFSTLGSGWHELDTGPVPAMSYAALTWTGEDLVVAGDGQAFAYRPGPDSWRTLTPPPAELSGVTALAWTGDVVVAVGNTGAGADADVTASTWDPGTDTWTDVRQVPFGNGFSATGVQGPRNLTGGTALVSTGVRVIDLTHGAVFDPTTDAWSTLALPDDLLPYSGLLATNPVWDGHEVVLAGLAGGPALAWDAEGSAYRVIHPQAPPELPLEGGGQTVATADGNGRIVLVSNAGTGGSGTAGEAVALDPVSGAMTALAAPPGIVRQEGCPGPIAAVGDRIVLASCDGSAPSVLAGSAWRSTGAPGFVARCCLGQWLSTGDALVVWDTDTDTLNGNPTPYRRAEIWVP